LEAIRAVAWCPAGRRAGAHFGRHGGRPTRTGSTRRTWAAPHKP